MKPILRDEREVLLLSLPTVMPSSKTCYTLSICAAGLSIIYTSLVILLMATGRSFRVSMHYLLATNAAGCTIVKP